MLVDDEDGMSANMERILRNANQEVMGAQRILELNPSHPLIENLARLHAAGRQDDIEPFVHLLLDNARLMDGAVQDPAALGRRLQSMLQSASQFALTQDAEAQP